MRRVVLITEGVTNREGRDKVRILHRKDHSRTIEPLEEVRPLQRVVPGL